MFDIMHIMVRTILMLDRTATLAISSQGHRNSFGEWKAGAVTEHVIWGCLKNTELDDVLTLGGNRQEWDIEFITRYRADLLTTTDLQDVYLIVDGVKYSTLDVGEMPKYGRRRYMLLKGASST